MFNPSRLSLARRRRGLTKADLGRRLHVPPRTLLAYERGEYSPSDAALASIARELGFPIEFFHGPTIDVPNEESVSFRSMSGMTAAQRDAALGAAALGGTLWAWIDGRFELPEPRVPSLRDVAPQAAAEAVRAEWGLGERPVKNVVHLLEASGVRVLSLAERNREVDAFSFWNDATPYVFLNTQKSSEHSRFDGLHELGHLVLHRHGGPRGKAAEREADSFASAFLMPRGSVLATAPRSPDIRALVGLKSVWNVSVAALTYRLHELDLLSDWGYRNAYMRIGQLGYRTREPEPTAPREASQLLHKVFQELRSENIGRPEVARELGIAVDELDSLIFGLVLVGMPGGSPAVSTPRPEGAAPLRRI